MNIASKTNFGNALEQLKAGKRVTRAGWNGKGMFLFLVHGESITNLIHENYGNAEHEKAMPVLDAIYMKTADNNLIPWLASQTDVFAEDWEVV